MGKQKIASCIPDVKMETEQRTLMSLLPRPVLFWYDGAKRDLPWRKNTDPYRVWISEIMLQQTRVEAVKEGYERFLSVLPDLQDLAFCSEETLMKLWEGMGYYSRARNLQKAAKTAWNTWGHLPDSAEELKKLPGIGDYTAGAIASIAFGEPVPAVDGNVLRVLARYLDDHRDVLKASAKKAAEEWIRPVIPRERAGDFTQALMELGALICLPGAPKCRECPLQEHCLGYKRGSAGELPIKKSKKTRRQEQMTVFLFTDENGRIALQKRAAKGLLAGMWQLPNANGFLSPEEGRCFWEKLGCRFSFEKAQMLPGAVHIFSHVEWHMQGMWLALSQEESKAAEKVGLCWVTREELKREKALPTAFRVYRESYEKLLYN